MKWIKDEGFIRGNIPMTKFNVRMLTIAHMNIHDGDRFLDIGAGTGSISIEASLQGAKVTAIETEEEGISLIRKNSEKFNTHIDLIQGRAPKDLPNKKFNKVFIGGSKGELGNIFQYLENNLEKDGLVCGNFIMLKNLNEFSQLLEKYKYKDIETHMIQAAYMDGIGLLKGENPIFIIKGVKK